MNWILSLPNMWIQLILSIEFKLNNIIEFNYNRELVQTTYKS
jgi:hypothetical protein